MSFSFGLPLYNHIYAYCLKGGRHSLHHYTLDSLFPGFLDFYPSLLINLFVYIFGMVLVW